MASHHQPGLLKPLGVPAGTFPRSPGWGEPEHPCPHVTEGSVRGAECGKTFQHRDHTECIMSEMKQPHWLIPIILSALLALLLTWLGVNDWRLPWIASPPAPDRAAPSSSTEAPSGLTSPVRVAETGDGGGIDIRWTEVDDPELRGYSVYVTAVRPVKYEYSVPRYRGDSELIERHYPVDYLNELLAEANDSRRVEPGQLWYVCVQGMRETPLNVPIDPYIIPGTKACSEEFTLP